MHLFSTLHSGCNPPRVLSGCSRNHVIYCTYFCDCLGYTDTPTLHFKTSLHQGWGRRFCLLVLTFNYNLCGCWVIRTFPMTQTAMEVRENQFSVWPVKLESKVISCALQGGQNQYLFRMLQKGVQMLGQFQILKFAGLISPKEMNFSFHFPSTGFSLEHPWSTGAWAPLSSTVNGEERAALDWSCPAHPSRD